MSTSNELTRIKRSAEEASLHVNESSLRDCHQPFPDIVTLPIHLIMGSILPYVQDRSTWNSLCIANKELRNAGRTMTPPWPETTLPPLDQNFGMATVFSPCGHYLACATMSLPGNTPFVSILDRRNGQQTFLSTGGNNLIGVCLAFSGDGKYLSLGGSDGLIRIWPANSARKPTQHGFKTLPSRPHSTVRCLAFASDSNILASGVDGAIKLWGVEDGVCLHTFVLRHGIISFDPLYRRTSSLVFTGVGASIQCLAATGDGSLIRISWNNTLSDCTRDLIDLDGAMRSRNTCFSQCGSFLATIDSTNKLCLHEIQTNGMFTRTQIVTLPSYCSLRTNAGMAFSPDNNMLAVISDTSREGDTVVRLLDVKDLSLKRQWQLRGRYPVSLVVDPSSRYLATATSQGTIRLWTF
jgi:WD40 repeat protein